MRRFLPVLTLLTLMATLLAACGDAAVATATPAATAPPAATVAATRAASAVAPTTATGATTAPAATSAATAAMAAASMAPATGGTIRIGMIASLTGPYNPLGTYNRQAAELVVKQTNDAGGINGAKIELLVEDDQSNPAQGPIALKKLLSSKIVALIGTVFSSTCLALYEDIEAAKLPTINMCATDSNVTPAIRPHVFMTPPTEATMVATVLAYFKAEGKTKIAVLHDSTEYGATGWTILKAEAPKFGITLDENLYELTGMTFVPQLTKIKASDAQAVLSWGSGGPAVIITKEFRQLGLTVPLVFSAAQGSPLYLKPAGDAANGVVLVTGLGPVAGKLPDSNPSKALALKFDADFKAAYMVDPAEFAYNAHSGMTMMLNAIKKVGPDSAKIRTELENTTYTGVDGVYKYSPTNHSGKGPESLVMSKVENGQFVPIPPK